MYRSNETRNPAAGSPPTLLYIRGMLRESEKKNQLGTFRGIQGNFGDALPVPWRGGTHTAIADDDGGNSSSRDLYMRDDVSREPKNQMPPPDLSEREETTLLGQTGR